ncbi:hypothetical protein MUO14_17710 [Halobacillus shinanisalinarum]|uniref:Uncharacterized protein n=1 Tax=Halobacillus shinanisalinarum TaxID=2932258 RepID=A0ABY4GWK6_9BACI|nr:hypothetical protein [Halobacillus shinanisalinarum]UOQ92295.1 hypothetical protein MUO14_17710 [Halobacillus shinanisalinarum]
MREHYNEKFILNTKLQKLFYIILCPIVVAITLYIITLFEGEAFRLELALPIMIGVSLPQWIMILFFPNFYRHSKNEKKLKGNQFLKGTVFYLIILVLILLIALFFSN